MPYSTVLTAGIRQISKSYSSPKFLSTKCYMVISVILFVVVIAAVTTFGNADITSLEKKVDLISSMQSFVLQDMMLIKGKLANTDVKLEQLFNQIDKLQSSEHERVSTEKGIEQTSAKISIKPWIP
ncbi:hypothetical protein MAR_002881 [Mya arenaria]|uniref:Uncharacterized protein n=1 Tax=Mya arenaria TaxID=6604 RepID=A0ABY7G4D8_MYAAR|nr:hypothetical protein MAR_002881 [Mya arenaria]